MDDQQEQVLPVEVPRLPPQMFTTAAQLLDLTDKKILCALRDGRKLFGVLRSWDQFGNIQLMDTYERYYVTVPQTTPSTAPKKLWGEVSRGLYLIRGENVAYLGEIDLDLEDEALPGDWEQVDAEQIHRLDKAIKEEQSKEVAGRQKRARRKGLVAEGGDEVIFV